MQFRGKYWFLSNFYPSPVWRYPTAEHAYQAAKTTNPAEREAFRLCKAPGLVKKMARMVTLRPEWKADPDFRLRVMDAVVRKKFAEHPDLAAKLVATGDEELVEDNWWGDTYWGRCNGVGENHLGRILMRVRSELVPPPS